MYTLSHTNMHMETHTYTYITHTHKHANRNTHLYKHHTHTHTCRYPHPHIFTYVHSHTDTRTIWVRLSVVLYTLCLLKCKKIKQYLKSYRLGQQRSTKSNRREPQSCLGQLFKFKLGRFIMHAIAPHIDARA
jgi:hypothetical protein